jgi:hypothetical protein
MVLIMRKFSASLAVAFLLLGCSETPTPRDAELLENFRRHQEEFSRLVQMLKQDRRLQHLWSDSITPTGAIDEERWNEYRKILSRIGVRGVHANLGDGSKAKFRAEKRNYASYASYEKGYVYSEKKPEVIRESLDLKRSEVPPYAVHYRHIEGNWYLYYENQSG